MLASNVRMPIAGHNGTIFVALELSQRSWRNYWPAPATTTSRGPSAARCAASATPAACGRSST